MPTMHIIVIILCLGLGQYYAYSANRRKQINNTCMQSRPKSRPQNFPRARPRSHQRVVHRSRPSARPQSHPHARPRAHPRHVRSPSESSCRSTPGLEEVEAFGSRFCC